MARIYFLVIFALLLCCPFCAHAESLSQAYVLGPQDQMKITVYGEDDLSDIYSVDGKGAVSVPLIGEVFVSGLSVSEAEKVIAQKLSDGYLVDPSVSIEISTYRPFYILGEVRTPGSYPYFDHITVLKAVALAGGFTYRANNKRVEILRGGEAQSHAYEKFPTTAHVKPGDVIVVKERFF